MSLDELLCHLAARRLVLTWSRRGTLILWAPCTYVPMPIRRAIPVHRCELEHLIDNDSIETCPNRHLHMQTWLLEGKRFVCAACRRVRMDRGA
jgi:hypothetical protein